MKNRYLVIALILLACLATGLAYCYSHAEVCFVPSKVDLVESRRLFVAGESLDVPVVIRNNTWREVSVTSLRTSCGCMVLGDVGGQGNIALPFTLAPNASHPLTISIGTAMRSGKNEFVLVAAASTQDGKPVPIEPFVVRAEIRPSFVCFVETVVFTCKAGEHSTICTNPTKEIVIASEWAEENLKINRVEWLNKGVLQCDLRKLHGTVNYCGKTLHSRYRLLLTLKPESVADSFSDRLALFADRPNAAPLTINVICKCEQPYQVSPGGITFYGRPGEIVRKELTYLFADSRFSKIRYVGETFWPATVEKRDRGDHCVTYAISCKMPSENRHGCMHFVLEPSGRDLSIPIRMIVSPD
jgi:hypothetical protein